MSYATVMVHVEFDAAADDRIRLALGLAAAFEATLIGVAAWAPRPPFVTDGIAVDGELVAQEYRYVADQLATRERSFRALAAAHRQPIEWRSAADLPTEYLADQARAADLIVIGHDSAPADAHRLVDPASLLLRSGRPVIAVPAGVSALAARRVVIGWKDTRESRRAVSDALPLLHRAEEVSVVSICEDGMEKRARAGVDDVAGFLGRHRIDARVEVVDAAGAGAGDVLLRLAAEREVDLVVAGAYGRSRLGEWIFGGATRTLTTKSPICCLFSH